MPGEPSLISPQLKASFLGTNRLPHCDHTLYHYEQWTYSIDASGVFNGHFSELNVSPFPINVGNSVVISGKYYTVSSINNSTGDIICNPSDPNDVLAQGSGWGWTLYNGCGINENYYTNEVLKFGFSTVASGSTTGYRVIGTPKLTIRFTGQNGIVTRYAEFKEEFSSYSESNRDGYFEFQYVVQGVDNGVPEIIGSPSDGDNTIRWNYSTGSQTGSLPLYWTPVTAADRTDMTRVRVNMDGEPSGKNNNQVTILLKRSDVPGKAPVSSDLILGEPALNTSDGKLFIKKEDNSIVSITPIEPQIFTTRNINITSSQNNLDLGSSSTVRLNPTVASTSISGFTEGRSGEIKLIFNAGTQSLNILHDSNNSTQGNRVLISGANTFSLEVNSGVTILYDGVSNAWRLF
jgi:hypothetical protein